MRTLQNNEVVLCKTEKQFRNVCEELNKNGILIKNNLHNQWKEYKANTCIRISLQNEAKYAGREYYSTHGFAIMSYSYFMGNSWTPNIGDKIWYLSGGKLKVCCGRLSESRNNKHDLQWAFKTRALARIAKQNLLECINKQVHG